MILSYPPPARTTRSPEVNRSIEQERENVDRWLVGKAKAQLETRNLLLIENHENISTNLAQLEDESFELVPLRNGTSWGTNSEEVKSLLQSSGDLDLTDKSDCEALFERMLSELQTNASYVAFPAEDLALALSQSAILCRSHWRVTGNRILAHIR